MKNHISRLRIVALAGLLTLGIAQSATANLIVNGGFETADFTGWTQTGNTGFTFVQGQPHSGNFAAWFGPVGSHGFITQNIATTPGTIYTIDFWLANLGGPPNFFSVNWDGASIFSLTDSSAFGYTEFTFDVTASTASTPLQFEFMQNPSFWLLDDVRVNAVGVSVPDSGSTFSLLSLTSLCVAALRRKLGLKNEKLKS